MTTSPISQTQGGQYSERPLLGRPRSRSANSEPAPSPIASAEASAPVSQTNGDAARARQTGTRDKRARQTGTQLVLREINGDAANFEDFAAVTPSLAALRGEGYVPAPGARPSARST